ncbi:MAG: tetratricopeptide repeat protein [Helicobacteraceae bacterium]|nr:tetratricopeptide repeat protein [Helicobacteraceae bacterium]
MAICLSVSVCCATKPILRDEDKDPIETLTRQIERDPNDYNLYWGRANAYLSLRDYEKAIFDYSKALSFENHYKYLIHFDRAQAYFKRASSLGDDGKSNENYEKAIADYSKHIEYSAALGGNDHYRAYMQRGYSRVALKRYDLAIEDFKSAIKDSPYQPHPYRELADVCVKLGDYGCAIESYSGEIERARPFYPDSAYIKRAELYELIGEREKAINDAKKACEISLGDCATLERLQSRPRDER